MAEKHHYVPKFYLEGFVDPVRSSYVWVADIERKVLRKESPKKAARISGYYDLESEDFPNKSILEHSLSVFESRTTPIIHQLRNGHLHLSIQERYHLANFIGLQVSRVPIFRQHLDSNLDKGINQWLQNYVTEDDKFQDKLNQEAQAFKSQVLAGKLKIQLKFNDDTHRKNFIVAAAINSGFGFAGIIFGMRWVFLLAPKDISFFTSDNPARLMSPDAKPLKIKFEARNEHLEISFPISPSCTLWMHARSERPDIIKVEVNQVDSDVVKELNRRILPTIQRFAYCSSEGQAKWVLRQF